MAVAAGKVPLKLLPCVLNVCIFLWHLHLFIAARFLLACVFRELVSGLDICLSSCSMMSVMSLHAQKLSGTSLK